MSYLFAEDDADVNSSLYESYIFKNKESWLIFFNEENLLMHD
jgi:hypothetical protein